MTAVQIAALREASPFREFDLFLADGRVIRIEHSDLIQLATDGRTARIYTRPDLIEYLDLSLVVSSQTRSPGLFDDETPEA